MGRPRKSLGEVRYLQSLVRNFLVVKTHEARMAMGSVTSKMKCVNLRACCSRNMIHFSKPSGSTSGIYHCVYFTCINTYTFTYICTHILRTNTMYIHEFILNSTYVKQGKSEGFDSCDRPSNLKLDSNRRFFSPCDREIWWMTSKNNRALFLYYVKLCASFQIHWWIQTGVTVQKRSIRVEIGDILSCVTLKFDGSPWKTIGHLFYTTSSFVHHFKSIGEVKLELQSGNAQFGSKLAIFSPVWPWNMTDDLEKQ